MVDKEKVLKLAEAESGKFAEKRSAFMLKSESLEGKVAALIAELAFAEDEPKDTKDLKTRPELVARFQLVVDDARAVSEGSFDNTLNQIRVLNPGVELNTSVMGVNYYVADRKILVPDYLREVIDQLAGDSA